MLQLLMIYRNWLTVINELLDLLWTHWNWAAEAMTLQQTGVKSWRFVGKNHVLNTKAITSNFHQNVLWIKDFCWVLKSIVDAVSLSKSEKKIILSIIFYFDFFRNYYNLAGMSSECTSFIYHYITCWNEIIHINYGWFLRSTFHVSSFCKNTLILFRTFSFFVNLSIIDASEMVQNRNCKMAYYFNYLLPNEYLSNIIWC